LGVDVETTHRRIVMCLSLISRAIGLDGTDLPPTRFRTIQAFPKDLPRGRW
jgi:hypothetical protein